MSLKDLIKTAKKQRSEVENIIQKKTENVFQSRELPENAVRIVFNCLEGSVSHYYHFFYGAMIPLIEYHLENLKKKIEKQFLITTNVGPFQQILLDLFGELIIGFEEPIITSKEKYFDDKSMNYIRDRIPGEIILPAYDIFNTKIYRRSDELARHLNRIRPSILDFIENKKPITNIIPTPILLIQRETDQYYINKRETNINRERDIFYTSGKQRRDILNINELYDALKQNYGNDIKKDFLEGKSIYYQNDLFSSTNILIAQHGASLANLFFMPPNSNVIEMMSNWGIAGNHFANLSDFLRLNYNVVYTENNEDIGYINIHQVLSTINRIKNTKQSNYREQMIENPRRKGGFKKKNSKRKKQNSKRKKKNSKKTKKVF